MGGIYSAPVPPVPIGTVLMHAGATLPRGYLACDGSQISRTTYSALFNAITTAWGSGNGTTTFHLPDLRDRFPVGAGSTYGLAASGGEATHALSAAEMPSHDHGGATGNAGNHSHGFTTNVSGIATSAGGVGVQRDTDQFGGNASRPGMISAVGDHAHSIGAQGGGAAHENRPPYRALNFIIRAS